MPASDLPFSAAEEPQVENYRPLSGLAVTAILLGLLSPLGIVGQYALVLPILGTVVSVAALRRIRASEGELSGRRLALAGLTLSLFFGAWATTQLVGRRWLLSHEARRFCDQWLQLVQEDRTREAFQWTLEPERRVAPSIPLDTIFDENEEARKALREFFYDAPFPADDQGSALRDFQYLRNQSIATDSTGEEMIFHRYRLTFEKDGKVETAETVLYVTRSLPSETGVIHWQVRDIGRTAEK